MRVICNAKHPYAICLKLGDKCLTPLTKLELEAKTRICSTIKKIYFYIVASFRHMFPLS